MVRLSRSSSGTAAAPGPRLGSRVTRSAGWSLGARILARAAGLITTLVLARLLTPEAFGIVGLALLANGLFEAFSQIGLREYLIYRQRVVRPLLGTAWTIIILRSALISLLLVLAAPGLAAAFDMPEATGVLRVMALIPLLRGLTNIETVYFMKRLDFRRQFLLDAAPQVGTLLVGIALALWLRNAWALALGHLAGAALQVMVSFAVCPAPRPQLLWRRGRLMFRFGLFFLLGSVAGYFALRGGEWVVAGLFDSHGLGLYVLAVAICQVPTTDFLKPVGRVLFPTFALLRSEPERLVAAFSRSYALVVASAAPLCLGLVLVAPDFAAVVLGHQWLDIAPLLMIVGIAALAQVVSTAGLGVFFAMGRPELEAAIGMVGILALVIAVAAYLVNVPPAGRDLLGVATCAAVAQVAQHVVRLSVSTRLLGLSPARLGATLLPSAVALGVMTAAVLVVQAGLAPGPLRLGAAAAVGGPAYCIALLAFSWVGRRGALADTWGALAQLRQGWAAKG